MVPCISSSVMHSNRFGEGPVGCLDVSLSIGVEVEVEAWADCFSFARYCCTEDANSSAKVTPEGMQN